jgi:hypothetical protein
MAPEGEIEAIELRRLAELEKQAALYGPQTDPAILIEIAEKRTKYPRPVYSGYSGVERRSNAALDYEFLMNTVAASLQRVTAIEAMVTRTQTIGSICLIVISLLLLYVLFGR